MKKPVIHVIPNAHLDPVWLWDAREGHNEGIATCRTMVDLLDANPDLTFIRGEAAIYEHVRRHDPATFQRILRLIRAGRWDAVGGTWIQPDTNQLESEVLCRHFEVGLRYFREKLGVRVKCGWQADSFGHSAGLPDVFAAGGVENFAFTRPPQEHFPLKTPAFWWHGHSGARVLGYRSPVGWYGCERDEVPHLFNRLLPKLKDSALRNIGLFIGLGNHGGGPSQRLVDDVRAAAAQHPELEVRFGGLHSFFAALRRELAAPHAPKIDEVRGELNFSQRGCYAAVARFKHAYRRAEHELLRAERTTAVLQGAGLAEAADFTPAWQSVLFNSFHDILPGSSIERAMEEQADEVGGVRFAARQATAASFNQLIPRVRIALPAVGPDHPKAVPFLVWNPHLRPLRTMVEFEATLDHRPIMSYLNRAAELPVEVRVGGRRVPFQLLPTEHDCFPQLAWRKRMLVPMDLPAAGWNVVTAGWVEGAVAPVHPKNATGRGQEIRNDFYRVSAQPGATGIRVWHRGRSLFGAAGLQLTTVADNWGSWGSMGEEPAGVRLRQVIGQWRVAKVALIEAGPLRAALAVRLTSRAARVDLILRLTAGEESLAMEARVFTDLEAARIKLVLPGARSAVCEVPAGTAKRTVEGEVPVLRWVKARDGQNGFAIASDVLAAWDLESGALRVTLARATRFARDENLDKTKEWWRPTVDRGELRERLVLLPLRGPIEQAAELLTQPPLVTMAWENRAGTLPTSASLASLTPPDVRVFALKPSTAGRGLEVRLQNAGAKNVRPVLTLAGRRYALGAIEPGAVATFRLGRGRSAQGVRLGR